MQEHLERTEGDISGQIIEGVKEMGEEEIRQKLGEILEKFEIGSQGNILFTDEEIELTPVEREFIKAAERRLKEIYINR